MLSSDFFHDLQMECTPLEGQHGLNSFTSAWKEFPEEEDNDQSLHGEVDRDTWIAVILHHIRVAQIRSCQFDVESTGQLHKVREAQLIQLEWIPNLGGLHVFLLLLFCVIPNIINILTLGLTFHFFMNSLQKSSLPFGASDIMISKPSATIHLTLSRTSSTSKLQLHLWLYTHSN